MEMIIIMQVRNDVMDNDTKSHSNETKKHPNLTFFFHSTILKVTTYLGPYKSTQIIKEKTSIS